MGYNANLVKAGTIPARKGLAAGDDVVFVAIPAADQRVTIPYLRLKAGPAGGSLAILQTEGVYKFSLLSPGSVISVPGIPAGLAGRCVMIRFPSGETVHTVVDSQSGEALTLQKSLVALQRATLYLMGTPASESSSTITLAVSASTVLQGDCPGVIMGREIGWPLALYMENGDGSCEIEGGTVAYIAV